MSMFDIPPWDPVSALMPLEQKIYLSLLGTDAWHMYRTTATPVSMVLPLFPVENRFNAIFRGAHKMLRAMKAANVAGSSDGLEAVVWTRFSAVMDSAPPEDLMLPSGEMRAVLDHVFADTQNLMPQLNSLVTLMMHSIERYYPLAELTPFASIWFDLCDAAVMGKPLPAGSVTGVST